MKDTRVTQTPQVISNVIDINSNSNTTWSVTQTLPFDAFWSAYPRKIAKGHARKAFDKACKIADPIAILTAVQKFADATQTQTNSSSLTLRHGSMARGGKMI